MEEGEQQLVVPRSNTDSMVSVTLGRAMSALLSARPKKLRDAVCRFSPSSRTHSLGSLEESLWFLYKYVQETAERMEQMDQIIIPMVEHSLRSKESKHGGQVLILLSWLFQDEFIFQSLMRDLVNIISRKEDRYIALGWCTLVRELVQAAHCSIETSSRLLFFFFPLGLETSYPVGLQKTLRALEWNKNGLRLKGIRIKDPIFLGLRLLGPLSSPMAVALCSFFLVALAVSRRRRTERILP
ncbi:hypothetical protein CDL15_Pgr000676 [Punica granatum]|uniref:Uncharacterized protein n=1 Tax=Punica granatum TaxID=22663 RepID=A0A218W2Y5_PUNGR|nr:hypothetical protein CDL15_Pgr000676 [Punica granatum]